LETIDDEQCHLLPSHKEINHNSRPVFKDIDNRLNPYMTYFHLPINENFESNIQDLPLAATRSDHRIIQMYHDESQC
jgi:phosphatidylinositol kinase/protein kinase (PI-3  family)